MAFSNEDYELKLILTLPESEKNLEIGTFDVAMIQNETVYRRMQSMRYTSPMVRHIRAFFLFFPIIFGLYDEIQEVQVNFNYHNIDEGGSM